MPIVRQSERPKSWTLGLGGFLAAITAPLIWLAGNEPPGPYHGGSVVLVVLVVVYSAGRLAWLLAQGVPRIMTMVFYLSVYVCYGVAPAAEIATGHNPTLLDPGKLLPATVAVLIGCGARDIGSLLRPHPVSGAVDAARDIAESRVKALAVLGLIGAAYYVNHLGGAAVFFQSREDVNAASGYGPSVSGLSTSSSLATQAIINAAGTVPVLIAWVAWTVFILRTHRRRLLGPWLGWLILAAVNAVVNNPISSSRYWFLTVAIAFAFALPSAGAKFFRASMVIGTVAAIVVFPYADRYRYNSQTNAAYPVASKSVQDSLATKDYDQLTMIANGMSWIDIRGGHTDGQQLLSSATFFIPHSVWAGRARDTGVEIAQVLPTANANQNLSGPLWIEFWADFGWAGLIFGFLIFGWLSRWADDLYVKLRAYKVGRPKVLDVAVPVLVGYEFIILRGSLLQAMARLATILVCLWFLRATRRRSESDRGVLTSPGVLVSAS